MKKILVMVLLVIFLNSCCILNVGLDQHYESMIKKSEILYSDDFINIEDIDAISSYLDSEYEYIADEKDSWNPPIITYINKYGDCEDFAILYINILYARFEVKGNLALINVRKINNGGIINHAIVEVNGIFFDPITLEIYPPNNIGFTYSFDSLFTLHIQQ